MSPLLFDLLPRLKMTMRLPPLPLHRSIAGLLSVATLGCSVSASTPLERNVPYSEIAPQVINLGEPFFRDREGGLITADLDNDGQRDIVLSRANRVQAYRSSGELLWSLDAPIQLGGQAERNGLPGLHGSGLQAGDPDQDGRTEVLFVTTQNTLMVIDGATGAEQHRLELPAVDSRFGRWEHAILANFRGEGDLDLLLQASQDVDNEPGYIRDSNQAAFAFADLVTDAAAAVPLWQTTDFLSASHGAAKAIDLDLDGRDEVVAGSILSSTGDKLYEVDIPNHAFHHIDSLGIGDIDPDRPGLEVIIPEEGRAKRIILYDQSGTIWESAHRRRSPDGDGDKAVVGEFDVATPGLETWFRGGDSDHFTVLTAAGNVIASYTFDDRKPDTWTDSGLEVVHRIRWTGSEPDYIVAKERHEAGDVGIFDPLTGLIVQRFETATDRLYVADVTGDWREEIIVVAGDQLQIYTNPAANPNPDRPRLWESPHYRRLKMTWNYYSP